MLLRAALLCVFCSSFLAADLTTDQKISDFNYLAGLYAKNYQPYQWKRDALGFDLYNVKPWLEQVRQSKTDLEYYDVCVRYVASLQDSHDEFTLLSDYQAYLHFDVDIYDAVVLIESIDRSYLPLAKFPFRVGDEVISVDGIAANDLIAKNVPYAVNGSANVSSRRRLAADLFTFRYQGWYPLAPQHGPDAVFVIRHQSGAVETYRIPWDEKGTPILGAGPVMTPLAQSGAPHAFQRARRAEPASITRLRNEFRSRNNGESWGSTPDQVPEDLAPYLKPVQELAVMKGLDTEMSAGNFGDLFPLFDPPPGFKLRLGASSADQFLSGTFISGGKTFGFIRIPTMSPTSTTTALRQFAAEMLYMQANTAGLLIDVMENGGGNPCYSQSLVSYLTNRPFRGVAAELRATDRWVVAFSSTVTAAKAAGAETWVVDSYSALLNDIKVANAQNRGDTGSIPLCGPYFENTPPAVNQAGVSLAYTKPIVVLVDEFTLSVAETFAMMLQDEKLATIFGTRTDGGGGTVNSYQAGAYSEGRTRMTESLVTRKTDVKTPGFPASHYVENTGVYPDIVQDFMTRDNFANGGQTFFDAAVAALKDLVK